MAAVAVPGEWPPTLLCNHHVLLQALPQRNRVLRHHRLCLVGGRVQLQIAVIQGS